MKGELNYEAIAVELLQALRGKRSCADFSRRMGYSSNVAHRWESQRSWPTAARYLQLHRRLNPGTPACLERFFRRPPDWLETCDPESPEAVAAFLRALKGKTSIDTLAELGSFSRYQVSRWLSAQTQPKLPEFLRLVEVASRRLLDLLATCVDPERLPSVAKRWRVLQAARNAAYQDPWSHAALRALEIGATASGAAQIPWLAERLGIDVEHVRSSLKVLETTGQIKKKRGRFTPRAAMAVNTARDPTLSLQLKQAWSRVAVARLEQGAPGNFGYSLFAISRRDLQRLRDLHLAYVRAMQDLIAQSRPNECVGLYCAQLLDLGVKDNALE